ncbi:FecR family protein [Roseomonas sp. USHLN139]|uniref:FecR family protein n=1 Tax=Roseomonas sp. USHLN139 TaxID=3081298 RepID=UPI003B027167
MAPNDPDQAPDPLWAQALTLLMEIRAAPQDAELRQAWQRWIGQGPQHQAAWREAERIWLAMGEAIRELPPASPPSPPLLPRRLQRRLPGRRRVLLAAGGGALATALLLAAPELAQGLESRLCADLRSAAGESRAVQLPDGSRLELDTATAIELDLSGAARRLRLLQGQAFITVAPEAARPFLLRCAAVEVATRGAALNLRCLGDRVEIAVQEGQAEARFAGAAGPSRPVALAARQSLSLSLADGAPLALSAPPERAMAWRDHRLVVEQAAPRAVLQELGRYLPGLLWLRGAALGAGRISGVYDLHDIPAALRQVVAPLGGRVRAFSTYLVVVDAP